VTPVAHLAVIRVHIVPLLPENVASSMRSGEIDLAIGAISVSDNDPISIDTFSIDTFA
jgi:hypothetical protein